MAIERQKSSATFSFSLNAGLALRDVDIRRN
jgi:hypothetical protein